MRGKQLADSTFHCPDCNQLLHSSQTADGEPSISAMTIPAANQATSQISVKARLCLESLRRWSTGLSSSPVLISWIIAGMGALLILVVMILDHNSADNIATQKQAVTVTESPTAISEPTKNPDPPEVQQQTTIPPAPEPEQFIPVKPDHPAPPKVTQALIAVKPKQIPPLVAQKPQPAASPLSPKSDVNLALQIPIIEFRQPQAVPLKKLIRQMEEMLDTQFHVADNIKSDSRLMNTPISFSLKNSTFSILLKQILSKAALTFTVKSNMIYIERAEAL